MLIGAGIAWIMVSWLHFSGIATGSSLILSGMVPLALLAYSYRTFRRPT